jgi:cytoskeletal protein CcmA (bactofilin family)
MWAKAENGKQKSSSSASPSPDRSAQQLSAAALPDSSRPPGVVSQGIKIKGEISGQGDFFLDGGLEGKVYIPDGTFTVGPNGRVSAEIEAREIIIHGEVIGTLKAHERLQICGTARVTGDMETRGIVVEDGAILHSKVATPEPTSKAGATDSNQGAQTPRAEIPERGKGAAAGGATPARPQKP